MNSKRLKAIVFFATSGRDGYLDYFFQKNVEHILRIRKKFVTHDKYAQKIFYSSGKNFFVHAQHTLKFFLYIFYGLECVGHCFAYVTHSILKDVWILYPEQASALPT
jgi:hypothetical protein